jgi:hypothetical protein
MTGRVFLTLAALLAATAGTVDASDRYDPRLRFRTLITERFDIHFHQGEEALAQRLAAIAEAAAAGLEPKLGRPSGRVHVILVNQDDLSNGWATPLPFNVIEIVAAAPRGSSVIGNGSDWLRLVFVHEYTHILHLDRSTGLFGGLRRVFGRHPVLLPNVFVPLWQIEGLATYYESATTGEGRIPAGDFRSMLHRAAAAGRVSLDRASSVRVDWPSGNTPYLYGGYFHQYLAETYGEDSLAKLANATAGRIPYLSSGAYKRVFGQSLGDLWREFERGAAVDPEGLPNAATRLTQHGFVVSFPEYSPDGRLFYSISNPHRFPALMERAADGAVREIVTRVGGGRMSAGDRTIVFDQVEYVRSVGLQSDVYAVSTETGHVQRLTREARAADPDVSPDRSMIVCTVQGADRRYLATLPANGSGSPSPFLSEPDTNFASPRWSPDGRWIVAERQRVGADPEIVVIDVAARQVVRTLAGGRSVAPSWMPDGSGILFASDAGDGAFQIHRADLASNQVRRLVNAGDSAQSPILAPDGRTLVFVGYTAEGHDLFSIEWDDTEWLPVAQPAASPASDRSVPEPTRAGTELKPEPYRPGRQLLPRFWSPIIESDGGGTSFGAATAGSDALGRHAYAVGAAWSTRGSADWYGAYAYDRWRTTVFADTSEDTDSWLSGEIRTRQLNVGARTPFRRFRRAQSLFTSFHLSSERFDCGACEPAIDVSIERRALRGGWSFSSAKQYGYSISREDGVSASVAAEWAPEALGSSGDSRAITVDVRAFLPAQPRHGVFALRGAAASSWGDEDAVRVFGAGGSGRPAAGASFDRDAIALIRGFDSDDIVGRRAAVVNLDYRVPITWIERGAGTWPALLKSLHAAVFVDAGAAWNDHLSRRDRRASAGVELSADVVVGYVAPLTLASGIAWRHDPTRSERGATIFVRIGRGF